MAVQTSYRREPRACTGESTPASPDRCAWSVAHGKAVQLDSSRSSFRRDTVDILPGQSQQGQGQITYFDQHPVQGGLIGQVTPQHGVVLVVGDRQPLEPGRPMLVEMFLDANFIYVHLTHPFFMETALSIPRPQGYCNR